MGVGGFSDYASILKNYDIPVVPDMSLAEVQGRESTVREDVPSAVAPREDLLEAPERKDAALEDISITFNRQENFGYIGRDSDVRALDVERAIDEMEKDRVLQQYQYFVGSSRDLYGAEGADGTVIRKF